MAAMGARFDGWTIERVGISPVLDDAHRTHLERHGDLAQDLRDLTKDL